MEAPAQHVDAGKKKEPISQADCMMANYQNVCAKKSE
jgi:hypothetical protein